MQSNTKVTVISAVAPANKDENDPNRKNLLKKFSTASRQLAGRPVHSQETIENRINNLPMKNNILTSDLLIHLPCNGRFLAELQLRQILKDNTKDLVIRVSETRVEILFAEKKMGFDNTEEMKNKKKNGNWIRRILSCRSKKSKSEAIQNNEILEQELTFHGHIILPMYIQCETLEFSMNENGNLSIEADIKGAIPVPPMPKMRNSQKENGGSFLKRRTGKMTRRNSSPSASPPRSPPLARARQGSLPGELVATKLQQVSKLTSDSTPKMNFTSAPVTPFLKSRPLLRNLIKRNLSKHQLMKDSASSLTSDPGSPVQQRPANPELKPNFSRASPLFQQLMRSKIAAQDIEVPGMMSSAPASPFIHRKNSTSSISSNSSITSKVFKPLESPKPYNGARPKTRRPQLQKSCTWELMTAALNTAFKTAASLDPALNSPTTSSGKSSK